MATYKGRNTATVKARRVRGRTRYCVSVKGPDVAKPKPRRGAKKFRAGGMAIQMHGCFIKQSDATASAKKLAKKVR